MQERGRLIAGAMSLSRREGMESRAQETRLVIGNHVGDPQCWAPTQHVGTCGDRRLGSSPLLIASIFSDK